MAESYDIQRKKYLMLVCSLLLHAFIIFFLLLLIDPEYSLLKDTLKKTIYTTAQKNDQSSFNSKYTTLKSGASTFGTPIFFHHTFDIQKDSHEKESYSNQEIIKDNTKEDTSVSSHKKKNVLKDNTKKRNQSISDSKKNLSFEEKKSKNILPIKVKKQNTKNSSFQIRASSAKKQLTLADLAEGFLDTLNRGGNDCIDREGDQNRKPDFSDLKYLSYIKKVIWYMQNEWHATQDTLNIEFLRDCVLSLIITFAKDGTIQHVRVIQESGYPKLDEFLIKGIKNAGPYPPLPQHFNQNTFDLPLNIHNGAHQKMPWHMSL